MPDEFTIRPSREDDLAAIQAIYAREVCHGTVSFETDPPDVAEMAARRRGLLEAGYPYLVAELDSRVAGYAYAGPYHRRFGYRHTVENSLYLGAWARRLGIGCALLERLIEECGERGYRQMVAIVGDSANAASIRLHERCGFRMVGTLEDVGFKLGRWLDIVIMQRSLGGVLAPAGVGDEQTEVNGSE